MVTDVLDYIESYDNIRAVCGLNEGELPDATLALAVYRNKLSTTLLNIRGTYAPATEDENLQTIFDRLDYSDELYVIIQQLAIYTMADEVMGSVGLRAYKTETDGKASITRFSAEATFKEVRQSIKESISQLLANLAGIFDQAEETLEFLTVVTPAIDLVVGR